jgi:orotate phosphoribosyltransferase
VCRFCRCCGGVGRFRLASGKVSTYYINSKKALLHYRPIFTIRDFEIEPAKE